MNRTKNLRQLLLSLALSAGVFAAPAYAQFNVNINIAPPAPQYEVVPTVAPGYVWAPGYWAWTGERHVWVRGRTIVQRDGYRWAPDRWEHRDGGYYRTAGHWEQDHDYRRGKKEKKGWKHDKHDGDDHGERGNHGKHGGHDRGGRHEG